MNLKQRLDEKITPFRLLEHPFYQQWNEGTLSVRDLAAYAREYGAFIQAIPQGWQTLEDSETVAEELEHNQLWDQFAAALDTQVGGSAIPEITALIDLSDELFRNPVAAIGALYAFEVQQPETAATKLAGLRDFYEIPSEGERYFIEHANNHHEAEKLLNRAAALSPAEQETSIEACGKISAGLWNALSGILEAGKLN